MGFADEYFFGIVIWLCLRLVCHICVLKHIRVYFIRIASMSNEKVLVEYFQSAIERQFLKKKNAPKTRMLIGRYFIEQKSKNIQEKLK